MSHESRSSAAVSWAGVGFIIAMTVSILTLNVYAWTGGWCHDENMVHEETVQ